MKLQLKILIAAVGALAVAGCGCVGYHAYDVDANGFTDKVYEICPEETASLTLRFPADEMSWQTDDTEIITFDERNTGSVVGLALGETTVTAYSGIHWYKCHVIVRQHSYVEADCITPQTCELCDRAEGEPLGHDFAEADCTNPKTCSRCGETTGNALGHNLKEATCLEASVCKRCGETVGEPLGHHFTEATCTEPKICSRCESKEGVALGHIFTAATCELPSICQRCDTVTGQALGHNYSLTESGTTGNQNFERYVCQTCGKENIEYKAVPLDSSTVYNAMIELQSSYPEGTPWTNDYYYGWHGGIYSGGFGCVGFAFMLSDAAFGSARARIYYDASSVRVGDIVRINGDTHSVIVLEVRSDSVIVAEGNFNYSVHWGREISMDSLANADYFITRY